MVESTNDKNNKKKPATEQEVGWSYALFGLDYDETSENDREMQRLQREFDEKLGGPKPVAVDDVEVSSDTDLSSFSFVLIDG